jgi:starch phosphorylase
MEKGLEFMDAYELSRKEIVFTTHTPVLAGNESHNIGILTHMGVNNGLADDEMAWIGGRPFNMTVAALRMSRISNAVSELHRQTANSMWSFIDNKSPIIGITNGVHIPTWADEDMIKAAQGNGDLWNNHMKNKIQLIEFVKSRVNVELKPDVLLVGFSRRATSYKRNSLILTDERIVGHLLGEGKIQLVFSGKSHPFDDAGRKTIEDILSAVKRYPNAVAFLENYDMEIGKMLTRGCDVWLNNPRKPQEASGTSGMKAAMNGVLNLSILDGWWLETCRHGVNGWQFGDGFESSDPWIADANDLNALYKTLQQEVIPAYYNERNKWLEMMKNSILGTRDRFSIKRMIEEYYEKMYLVD